MKNLKFLATAFTAAVLFTGCSDDDSEPKHIHDNEEIEEFVITVSNEDGTNPMEYEFHAGDSKSEDVIKLNPNTTYNLEVTGMMTHHDHDGEEHEENIIDEIAEEKESHFLVYEKVNDVNFTLTRTDDAMTTRADGTKIGKKVKIMTGAASNGSLIITLKHEPTSVDASANGEFGSAVGGSSDVVATYEMMIE